METISLKALAQKVLERNKKGNSLETARNNDGNSTEIRVAYKVYSEILGTCLWVVDTDEDMHSLRFQSVPEAIYTKDEIKRLKGIDKDSLKEIHKVKETFSESTIEEIKKSERLP